MAGRFAVLISAESACEGGSDMAVRVREGSGREVSWEIGQWRGR